MGTDDSANLAVAALLRIAAEESEAREFTRDMENFIFDLTDRNGAAAANQLTITLARKHCALLDAVAEAIGVVPEALLEVPVSAVDRMQEA